MSHAEKALLINHLLDVLRLTEVKHNVIGPAGERSLSGGQLRRIALGTEILLRRSKILLLDEPTSGLSASGVAEIVAILEALAKTLQYTVIITIHQPHGDFERV